MHAYNLHVQNTIKTCHHELEAQVGTIETYRKILNPLESDYKVDSIFH